MSENKDLDLIEIEKEYMEMINKAEKKGKLSKEEYDKLFKEAIASTEFMKLLDDIKIPNVSRVLFTDGDVQLIYENGEFFIVSTLDSTVSKKKITRKEAIDLNIEYFIKYQINPIIEVRKKAIQEKEMKKVRTKSRTVKNKKIDLDDEKREEQEKKEENKKEEKNEIKARNEKAKEINELYR